MARTIVILHPGGLGDLLLAVPALRRLRVGFPQHRVILCAHQEGSALLQASGLVDEWTAVQHAACAALFNGAHPEDPRLLDWLSRCDLAVAWSSDDRGLLAVALRRSGAAEVLVQSPFHEALNAVHQSDRYVEILGERAADVAIGSSLLPLEKLCEEAQTYLHSAGVALNPPVAIVHPGSGSRHKCVRPDLLRAGIQGLEEQGVQPLLLEGPADREIVRDLLDHLPQRPILLRDLSLRLLAGVLSLVDLYVGHDSGVTHLAALLGVPTVALFGPTARSRWAPRGPAVTVLQGQPCQCQPWDAVKNCLEKPCLRISPSVILTACQSVRTLNLNPRNS